MSWSLASGNSNSAEQDKSDTFTHVISALPAKALLSALSNERSKRPALARSDVERFSVPTVTVMVVNLYFTKPDLIKYPGFGYLIPRSVAFEQNPEFALGVVFDSYATPDVDNSTGTKMTVMLGGHWWDGWTTFPSQAEGIRMARSLLKRHLDIVDEPALAVATLQKECIPQYHTGHSERAQALCEELEESFGDRIELAGASWHGVSVTACIKSACAAAYRMASGQHRSQLAKSMDPANFVERPVSKFSTMKLLRRLLPNHTDKPKDR